YVPWGAPGGDLHGAAHAPRSAEGSTCVMVCPLPAAEQHLGPDKHRLGRAEHGRELGVELARVLDVATIDEIVHVVELVLELLWALGDVEEILEDAVDVEALRCIGLHDGDTIPLRLEDEDRIAIDLAEHRGRVAHGEHLDIDIFGPGQCGY